MGREGGSGELSGELGEVVDLMLIGIGVLRKVRSFDYWIVHELEGSRTDLRGFPRRLGAKGYFLRGFVLRACYAKLAFFG